MLTLICPKCGKEKDKDQFIATVCAECSFSIKDIASLKTTELTICKGCGRVRYKNKWDLFSEDDLKKIVEENIKVSLQEYEIKDIITEFYKDKIKIIVKINGKAENYKIETVKEFNIALKTIYCDDCYKNMSDYFIATIQIRYTKTEEEKYKPVIGNYNMADYFVRVIQNAVKDLRKTGDFSAHIQKIEQDKNGINIMVGSKMQAVSFIKSIKPTFEYTRKDTKSMVGIDKKGHEKLRYTYLIRLK